MMRDYFAIGIENTKDAFNVGSLWRTADLIGAAFIFTIGRRYKTQASDTMKTARRVPLFHYGLQGLPWPSPARRAACRPGARPAGQARRELLPPRARGLPTRCGGPRSDQGSAGALPAPRAATRPRFAQRRRGRLHRALRPARQGGALVSSDSFEYLALRWSETPRFEPLWVSPAVLMALLSSPRFCSVAALTNPLERRAVRAEQVPVFTDGVRTIVDRHTCAAFAVELRSAEKRLLMVRS